MQRFKYKLRCIWAIITAESAHVIYQKQAGAEVTSVGVGRAQLPDLVRYAKELQKIHDAFLGMVQNVATEDGQLHNLKALQDAVEVLKDGRD